MSEIAKENKMGTMKVPKLLYTVSLPIIISMLVQALYNIVDSIFVASYNNVQGTGALTLAFPIQNLLLAVSIGLAVGINALLSRSLGQRNFEKADKVAGQGFFLMFCGYILFFVFGTFFSGMYATSQSAGDALLSDYTHEYVSIVSVGSVFVFVQILGERLLQATGKSVLSMITQGIGAIVNIILDPILIFGYFGLPEMGIRGAAIATIIGQFVAAVIGIVFNLLFNKEITIKIKNFLPDFSLIKEILLISIPSVLMQAIGTVMTLCMNIILIGFSQTALNVFGVYFKLQSFVFMPVLGLNNGMVPILSYNYGAKKRKRVFDTMKLSYLTAIAYTVICLLVCQLFPAALLSIFNATDEMIVLGTSALRTISWSFLFAGFSIVSISSCQALGKSIYGLFVSIGRQLVILIPAAFLLSLTGKVTAVWWAFPIAELASLMLCAFFVINTLKAAFPKNASEIAK